MGRNLHLSSIAISEPPLHTSYSDGVLTPSDAFQHARDLALLDFLAVTDHGYYFQEATNIHHWFMSWKRQMHSMNQEGSCP